MTPLRRAARIHSKCFNFELGKRVWFIFGYLLGTNISPTNAGTFESDDDFGSQRPVWVGYVCWHRFEGFARGEIPPCRMGFTKMIKRGGCLLTFSSPLLLGGGSPLNYGGFDVILVRLWVDLFWWIDFL